MQEIKCTMTVFHHPIWDKDLCGCRRIPPLVLRLQPSVLCLQLHFAASATICTVLATACCVHTTIRTVHTTICTVHTTICTVHTTAFCCVCNRINLYLKLADGIQSCCIAHATACTPHTTALAVGPFRERGCERSELPCPGLRRRLLGRRSWSFLSQIGLSDNGHNALRLQPPRRLQAENRRVQA